MARTALAIPPELARRSNKVLRPLDAAGVYAHPRAEIARLVENGVLRKIANGYYAIVPMDRLGDKRWRPGVDAVALGVGQADYGVNGAVLMGISAARRFGAIPRALSTAVVAVPKQRPRLTTSVGDIVFVKRVVETLDIERVDSELGPGWVTTIEQTVLDLTVRPRQGGAGEGQVTEAVRALTMRADLRRIETLAERQHRPGALKAIQRLFEELDAGR